MNLISKKPLAALAATACLTFASSSFAALAGYSQNFEGMDPLNEDALGNDGWLVGANVYDSSGTNYLYGYFAFPAPNVNGGGPAFTGVATGEGDVAQGNNQFNTYNDYNNSDHNTGNRIEATIFQDLGVIGADDVGETITFSFDNKVGNLGGATTATAYLKVLQTSNGSFGQLALENIATTSLGGGDWTSSSISLLIDAAWVGETLQFGFTNTASNFDGSGIFYDNINVSAVPVPAAAWLFGSALMGLVGLSRKRAA